ncbi:MAG: glyceraldehyde-3-phosphate dehydrogenase, partial [Flavobacteriaceae bacterium]|nr:glyceraldehyde-3-phosphate dehydrogenase [Flavobacteriaceae bacterium]
MTTTQFYETQLVYQTKKRKATVEFIKIVSDLWYDNSVELILFRNQLIDRNVSEILNLLEYSREFVQKPISIFDAVEIAQEIKDLNITLAKIDVGKLVYEFHLEKKKASKKEFVKTKLEGSFTPKDFKPKDVVLYGFGRIGRLLARELMEKTGSGNQLRLRAIVTRGVIDEVTLEKRASLLRLDSVHGDFPGTVQVDLENKSLIIDGTTVHMIAANAPEDTDYTQYGVNDALLIDNSGAYRDKESLGRHLKAKGISKVLFTAPGKGVPNIVYGVNHKEFSPDELDIFTAASCTTNAITPVLKVIEESFGIENGHLETIHAYTNDQNLVDNFHKKYRRGRAAAL